MQRFGGESLLHQMLELFFQSAPVRQAGMAAALAGGDLGTLEQIAHSLKSSAGNLGATRLQFLCQSIEAAAGAGEPDVCRSRMEVLDDHVEAALDALRPYSTPSAE